MGIHSSSLKRYISDKLFLNQVGVLLISAGLLHQTRNLQEAFRKLQVSYMACQGLTLPGSYLHWGLGMQGNQIHSMGLGAGKIHAGRKARSSALLEVPPTHIY